MRDNKTNEYNSIVGKFFVCQFQEGNLFSSTEINKEEFDKISDVNKAVRRLQYFKNKNLECSLNHMDYFKIVDYYFHQLKNFNYHGQKFNHEYVRMDINRVFNNFVISFKAMMELSEKMIIRHYSKDSYEYKEFKLFTGHFYDSLFSYRLFIRLRNYTTHYSEPINLKIKLKEETKIVFTPYFRKTQLLRFDEIRRKISSDLELYKEDFPVEPLMRELENYIKLFYPMIVRIIANTENPNIMELLNFFHKYNEGQNLYMSLGIPKSHEGNKIEMDFISLEIDDALYFEQIVADIP